MNNKKAIARNTNIIKQIAEKERELQCSFGKLDNIIANNTEYSIKYRTLLEDKNFIKNSIGDRFIKYGISNDLRGAPDNNFAVYKNFEDLVFQKVFESNTGCEIPNLYLGIQMGTGYLYNRIYTTENVVTGYILFGGSLAVGVGAYLLMTNGERHFEPFNIFVGAISSLVALFFSSVVLREIPNYYNYKKEAAKIPFAHSEKLYTDMNYLYPEIMKKLQIEEYLGR
ncbi:MAG: hypothetical protein LBL75_03535 [Rickettsiales bacterium]|jgi:hypothetical protein|nr:hypothetical protein [Rickettsiales bacterium]